MGEEGDKANEERREEDLAEIEKHQDRNQILDSNTAPLA
jgi:hypothetical protein